MKKATILVVALFCLPAGAAPPKVPSVNGSGSHFQSSSVNSSAYSIQDSSQVITLTGTGTHNGLPVSFTMVGVNYGDVAPGIFQITLTDGYVFNGLPLDGSINIQ